MIQVSARCSCNKFLFRDLLVHQYYHHFHRPSTHLVVPPFPTENQPFPQIMSCTHCWNLTLCILPSQTLSCFRGFLCSSVSFSIFSSIVFERLFVKRFALCYRRCVLSVTLVYCGQTAGWIKMPLGTEVGLGPGDIVLDAVPLSSRERGTEPPYFLAHVAHTKRMSIVSHDASIVWSSS